MTTHSPSITHPRIAARRAVVHAEAKASEVRRRRILWLFLAVALALLSGYLATRSELLDVERVAVEGANMTSVSDITRVAGISSGQPLVGLDLTSARTRIAQLPWVKDVYSTRSWNGAVTFTVTERTPVAALAVAGGWAVADEAGRILVISSEVPVGTLPITGLSGTSATPGDWLNAAQREAAGVVGAIYEPVRSQVRALEVTPAGYVLQLNIPGHILLGDATDLAAKMVALHSVIAQVNLRCLETLNLSSPATPGLTRQPSCL